MREFFKGLLGVVLSGSFGEKTVIDVLAGDEGQGRGKWRGACFGVVLFLGLALSLAGVGVADVMAGEWMV